MPSLLYHVIVEEGSFNYVFQGLAGSFLTLIFFFLFVYKPFGKGVGQFLKNNGKKGKVYTQLVVRGLECLFVGERKESKCMYIM